MSQELFNNILAVIGIVTGLSGLSISLFLLNKERLEFHLIHPTKDDDVCLVGFNGIPDGFLNGCQITRYSKYMLLVWLQITNKSKTPSTILEMTLTVDKKNKSTLNSRTSLDYTIPVTYSLDDNDNLNVISGYGFYKSTLKLPVYIEPYSTIEGHFCFRDLNFDDQDCFSAKIKIKTPQGYRNFKVTLNPEYPTLIKQD